MSRTESRTIKCFACFNEISLKVTLSVWNSKEFEYCIERSAERMGFRPTDKGASVSAARGDGGGEGEGAVIESIQWGYGPSDAPDKQFNWFNVTTWADRDWKAAVDAYWQERYEGRHDPRKIEAAEARIHHARVGYRGRVLSWYFKLCTPMQIDECTPACVAELLAEAWDAGEMRWWKP